MDINDEQPPYQRVEIRVKPRRRRFRHVSLAPPIRLAALTAMVLFLAWLYLKCGAWFIERIINASLS